MVREIKFELETANGLVHVRIARLLDTEGVGKRFEVTISQPPVGTVYFRSGALPIQEFSDRFAEMIR